MMLTMLLDEPREPLRRAQAPIPAPRDLDLLIRVKACGVCRTDLHIADGELPAHRLPLILGHEIVGTVAALGRDAGDGFRIGDRVGVPWLAGTCRHCAFCASGRENLCDSAEFTGYDRDGGYAEYTLADARYAVRLPDRYDDMHAAPLLCAGLIGYRAYAMAGDARRIGLYGFGAAAHIVAQIARHEGKEIHAFTRPGDARSQAFAISLGAAWAGGSDEPAPGPLDAAIIFASAGALVPKALASVRKGGAVVCAGIHMTDIPAFPYSLLWGERTIRSVANLTRADAERFFLIAAQTDIRTRPVVFPLERANDALNALRNGEFDGAAVLVP